MAIANDETQPYCNRDKAADVCNELAASDVASVVKCYERCVCCTGGCACCGCAGALIVLLVVFLFPLLARNWLMGMLDLGDLILPQRKV